MISRLILLISSVRLRRTGSLESFIASADTPPLEAGIISSGMKPFLDTPRLDAGSLESFIS
ncbi:MAG: hypothetical protein A3D87_04460 [Omnitrophica WOR_2 bacterium RIFCSPHIGHO2_02_FULL_50_17]|nr:MAG: hypothetical protein A3D87_04460 [Omnitrophica WOR_2 bacterium RIFCSPHIGHO2_02_FULL_50_17]